MEAYGIRTPNLMIGVRPANIGLRTHRGAMEIRQEHGRLSIEQRPARFEMRQEHFRVEIDQSQCFAEAGRKNVNAFFNDNIQRSKEAVSTGTARRVAEGRMLRDFEKGGSVGAIARNNFPNDRPPFTIVAMPQSRPSIDPIAARIETEFIAEAPNISYEPRPANITYSPGTVEIVMEQIGGVDINYIDTRV